MNPLKAIISLFKRKKQEPKYSYIYPKKDQLPYVDNNQWNEDMERTREQIRKRFEDEEKNKFAIRQQFD